MVETQNSCCRESSEQSREKQRQVRQKTSWILTVTLSHADGIIMCLCALFVYGIEMFMCVVFSVVASFKDNIR